MDKSLTPINSLTYVSLTKIKTIEPTDLTVELVGEKAYGLSSLPSQWTLPYIVISHELLANFKALKDKSAQIVLLNKWTAGIHNAIISGSVGNNIIVRSSGCLEGLKQRGELYSQEGDILLPENLTDILNKCLTKLALIDSDCHVPLILQKYIPSTSIKGHLSNERRFSKEKRDWIVEYEQLDVNYSVNIRKWRETTNPNELQLSQLNCVLKKNIKNILKIPAEWGTNNNLRIHFEWIWNQEKVYIVQADLAHKNEGVDPKDNAIMDSDIKNFKPKCLVKINQEHALKFHKIHNVFVYQKLDLPTAQLYVLSDRDIIEELAKGQVNLNLKDDITQLVKNSLVIRMDVEASSKEELQFLPRTQEEREFDSAIRWLIESSKNILRETNKEIAFIFHNFIPANASAFAYASPHERFVKIESLWGLPEGLYYNSHDYYAVDTHCLYSENLNINKFSVSPKSYYKHFFISPDKDGKWSPKVVKKPFDWNCSIEEEDWIKQIALQSRKIAEHEKKPLSIMWFVDVPEDIYATRVFPWHHEEFDFSITNRTQPRRKKYQNEFLITNSSDITMLEQVLKEESSNIGVVRIQPKEDELLRNKHLLKEIGRLTQESGAVILLEGAVLSHAFYQLMQTKAIVEITNPFERFSDKQNFNKLVRNKIPETIEAEGEIVYAGVLDKDSKLRALKDKLVEEAIEVLDCDDDNLLEELADVQEVLNCIIKASKLSKKKLYEKQKKKAERVGSFDKGYVLLKTENKVSESSTEKTQLFLDDHKINPCTYKDISPRINKNTDRRETSGVTEDLIKIDIPVLLNAFEISSKILNTADIQIQITGKREGAKQKISISVCDNRYPYHPDLNLED